MAEETSNQTIGQYELRSILGKGGMAAVWRAYQPSLDREVAIKVMAAQFSTDETFTKRFNQEARSIARLRHPNILAIYEYGQDKGQPYIVTELLDGGTLREFMRQPLDLKRASRIIHQVGDALDYAHAQGMVHRDIKPSNILMDTPRTGGVRAVLGDFGIVKLLESTNITQTGVGIGTPEYMSPEQAAGEPLDGRSDEYSLAIVLYEMLTGVTPYKADTPLAVMMGHVNKPLPDPRTFNPKLPQEVVDVLNKALAKYPQERYDSAGQFAEAFQQAASLADTDGRAATGAAGSTNSGTYVQNNPAGLTGNLTNSLGNSIPPAIQSGTFGGAVPATNPTGRFNPNAPVISSAQAYDYAVLQEEQGNKQAAFETFTDLYKREPSYKDVSSKIKQYESQGLQYTGQYTLFRPPTGLTGNEPTRMMPTGPYKNQTQQGNFIPMDPTGQRSLPTGPETRPGPSTGLTGSSPVITTTPKKSPVPVIAAVVGVVLLGVIAAIILLVVLPPSKSTTTPTAQANNVGTVTPANGTTTGPATTSAVVTTASTSTTAAVATTAAPTTATATTAAATTAAPTTPAGKPDAAGSQAMNISNAIYQPGGSLADGITKLKDLADKNQNSWVTQRELGKAYYFYQRDDGGVTYLKKAILLNPDDAMSNAYLALAYTSVFDDNNATSAITRARDLDQNSAEVLGAQAVTLLRTDVRQAKDKADAALKIDPNSMLGNYAKWASFVQTDEFDTALPYLDKLIAKYPTLASFATDKGYHYLRSGNPSDATTWYNNALAIDKDFPTAHAGLCEVAYLGGDNQKAIDECTKAVKTYDYAVYGHVYLGYALNNIGGKSAEAEAELKKAINLDLKNSTAYNGLAFTYIDRAVDPANQANKQLVQTLLSQAVDQADQAIKLDSTYADAYFNKGYALFLQNQFTPAQAPLEKAVQLRTDSTNYYTILAYDYFKLGDKDKARATAQKALDLDPNNEQAKQVFTASGG